MDLSSLSEEETGDAFGLYPHPLPDWIHVDCLGHAGTRQTLSTIQFDVNQVLGPYLGSSLGVAVLTTPGKVLDVASCSGLNSVATTVPSAVKGIPASGDDADDQP
jgi:hypothetical protein